jgi:hypothetical protein
VWLWVRTGERGGAYAHACVRARACERVACGVSPAGDTPVTKDDAYVPPWLACVVAQVFVLAAEELSKMTDMDELLVGR